MKEGHRVKFPCPTCGRERDVGVVTYMQIKSGLLSDQCKECRRKERMTLRVIQVQRSIRRSFERNGCTVWEAAEGTRCPQYRDCEHEWECLSEAADLGFHGFTNKTPRFT